MFLNSFFSAKAKPSRLLPMWWTNAAAISLAWHHVVQLYCKVHVKLCLLSCYWEESASTWSRVKAVNAVSFLCRLRARAHPENLVVFSLFYCKKKQCKVLGKKKKKINIFKAINTILDSALIIVCVCFKNWINWAEMERNEVFRILVSAKIWIFGVWVVSNLFWKENHYFHPS